MIDVRPPYPQDTRPEVCCVAWHARDAALKLVHACQHRAAPPVTSLPHVLRTPSLHLTARHPHTPLWLTDAMSRAQAPRQLLLLAQARPARLGHVPRAQELLVGGPIESIRTPHRCAHREPREPLTGVGGRPQPCLAARASSRSHARASAPAPPPEPALAVSLCTGCGRAVAELISTCPSGDVSPLPAPLAGRRTWQRAPMTPVSQCSICFLVLITVHKHDHTPHSMTTAESGRQEASVPPHPHEERGAPG